MRYLITGGAGFVGSHLVDALLLRGHEALVLDDLSTGRLENLEHVMASGGVELVQGSVLDFDVVDRCVRDADAVVHLASVVGVKLIVDRPLDSLRCNVLGTETVLSAAVRHRRKLLFASTSEVYGKTNDNALREDADRVVGSPFKARWSYCTAKTFGEALAHAYHRECDAEMIVVRLFNAVGPRQADSYGMVLPRFVRQALLGEDLTVYGNGTQTRCFTHVLDTVHAIQLLLETDEAVGRPFNVGSETEVPIVELARRVIERTGGRSRVNLVSYEDAYGEGFEELGRRRPDTTALRKLTGWQPTRTIDDAIDDVIAFEQAALSLVAGAARG